jgi:hypothetical protein
MNLATPFIPAKHDAAPAVGTGSLVAAWLLDGPAQLREGRHAGAVAGAINARGSVAYVYPEITGYYLQWLAWRARNVSDPDLFAERAASAQRWLRVWLAEDPPQTRVYLDGTVGDWRNKAVFCFDLAMVLRGLASVTQAQLLVPDATVVAGVVRQLEQLIGVDGAFAACVANARGSELPDRWSTRRGAFLAKAAAGIVAAARVLPDVPESIERAAIATFDASTLALLDHPHREVHPLLYAFEGVLAWPEHPRFDAVIKVVAAQFAALLGLAGKDGRLPESIDAASGATGPARVDVIAQTLRVGCLLGAHRVQPPPDQLALARLRHLLMRQLRPSGAVGFSLESESADCNAWAAMFADQALAFAVPNPGATMWQSTDPLLV